MKISKQALVAMVAAFIVLPGCGKKNDAAVVAAAPAPSVSTIGSGQCASVSYNSAQSIVFYGSLSSGSGIVGNLSAYGYGSQGFGGSNYYRNLNTGDTVNVYVSGSTAYAVLTITANTASAIVMGQSGGYGGYYGYSGSAQVCGMYINESIFASPISGGGYTGTMGGGTIALWGNNNWITYGNGQPILF